MGFPFHYDGQPSLRVAERARLAERLGFDDLWIADHVSWTRPIGDLQTMAGLAAGATDRIRICTGVIQAPLRHPVLVAKWLGSLAAEVPGRVLAGVGIGGDHRPEWERLGVDTTERAGRFEEILATLPRLLANEHVVHDGRYYRFDVPPLFATAPPRTPIWVGARTQRATLRAVGTDGWLAMLMPPEAFEERMAMLGDAARARGVEPPEGAISIAASIVGDESEARERCAEWFRRSYGLEAGRGRRSAIGSLDRVVDLVARYRQAGASMVSITLVDDVEEAWPILADALELDGPGGR